MPNNKTYKMPDREQSSQISGFQESLWENQKVTIEKKLANNGFILQASLKINQNGVVRGGILDKKSRTKLILEVNLAEPHQEGQRRFRITFADNPQKRFWIKENELEDFQNKPVSKIYAQKQDEEKRKTDMPPTGRPIIRPPEERPTEGEATVGKTDDRSKPVLPTEMGTLSTQPMMLFPKLSKPAKADLELAADEANKYEGQRDIGRHVSTDGVLGAKEKFEKRKRIGKTGYPETTYEESPNSGFRATFKKPGVKVGLIYGSFAAAGGLGFLWTALTA